VRWGSRNTRTQEKRGQVYIFLEGARSLIRIKGNKRTHVKKEHREKVDTPERDKKGKKKRHEFHKRKGNTSNIMWERGEKYAVYGKHKHVTWGSKGGE